MQPVSNHELQDSLARVGIVRTDAKLNIGAELTYPLLRGSLSFI